MKTKNNYNPDVLSCLANLSNDEVFTPPNLANKILDMLPVELWSNKDARFLDPVSKSGVFLREITLRLMKGLEKEIPDHQDRIDHILKNQVYGIAITELTSLLSRRSVYCSKFADGKYSICSDFQDKQGNIIFNRIEHVWVDEKCKYCNASKTEYDRGDLLETHAYQFIHTDKPDIIFNNMKFDVIIGNPPYQLSTGGSSSQATPLYNKFVEQAKKLKPRYLTMIIPSRWYAGGMGLDDFRSSMLADKRIKILVDFPNAQDCFPGVEIKGGVCYFLLDTAYNGDCEFISMQNGKEASRAKRNLNDNDVLIRHNEAISILEKIRSMNEPTLNARVSGIDPFKFPTNFKDYKVKPFDGSVKIYVRGGVGYIRRDQIKASIDIVDKYKILLSQAYGAGNEYPHQVTGKPILTEKDTCCTFTYLVINSFSAKNKANNFKKYLETKLFRFLVSLKKNTQHLSKDRFSFVPDLSMDEEWTDERLYKKYGITKEEQSFIDTLIRPME